MQRHEKKIGISLAGFIFTLYFCSRFSKTMYNYEEKINFKKTYEK